MESNDNSSADACARAHPADLRTSNPARIKQPISVQVVRCDQLTQSLIQTWRRIQQSNPRLTSPYFQLEFTLAVARTRDDVEIAVVRRDPDVVGFLPFQRVAKRHGEPVGGLLNDFHGPIVGPNDALDLQQVVHDSGLSTWRFHALHPSDASAVASHYHTRVSPYLDLSAGFAAYLSDSRQRAMTVKRQSQKTRGMIRDCGPLRFEFESLEFARLEHLIALKRCKYRRTKVFDVLSVPWCANLLREVHHTRTPNFRGIMSTLFAGRHAVALHLGMLSGHTLHYWFPVFDPRFAKYSPGTQLILETASHVAGLGVTIVDLSYGELPFKTRLGNDAWEVACGRIQQGETRRVLGRWGKACRDTLRETLFTDATRRCVRTFLPRFGQGNYR